MEPTNSGKDKSSLAIDIYRTQQEKKLTIRQVSSIYNITPSETKLLCSKAKQILKHGDYSWLDGLSKRARTQLMKSEYHDFDSLRKDVLGGDVDIEELPRIGHKVAMEIRRWCMKYGEDIYKA